MKRKYYVGLIPTHCDLCNAPLKQKFTDQKTIHGPWANLCFLCSITHGLPIGQEYKITSTGKAYKLRELGEKADV